MCHVAKRQSDASLPLGGGGMVVCVAAFISGAPSQHLRQLNGTRELFRITLKVLKVLKDHITCPDDRATAPATLCQPTRQPPLHHTGVGKLALKAFMRPEHPRAAPCAHRGLIRIMPALVKGPRFRVHASGSTLVLLGLVIGDCHGSGRGHRDVVELAPLGVDDHRIDAEEDQYRVNGDAHVQPDQGNANVDVDCTD